MFDLWCHVWVPEVGCRVRQCLAQVHEGGLAVEEDVRNLVLFQDQLQVQDLLGFSERETRKWLRKFSIRTSKDCVVYVLSVQLKSRARFTRTARGKWGWRTFDFSRKPKQEGDSKRDLSDSSTFVAVPWRQ